MSRVAVVTPIHLSSLTDDERMVVARYRDVFAAHPRVVAVPEGLDVAPLREIDPGLHVEEFCPKHFESFRAHQYFCLSGDMWNRFSCHEFVLVAHYDAWVFRDELIQWCDRGWPYIGTAWPLTRSRLWHALFGYCGGGGFSLRRVDWMRRLCRRLGPLRPIAARWNEDAVICNRIVRALAGSFRWPGLVEALRFGFESEPDRALAMAGGSLPFGCHGWTWPDRRRFWSQWITSGSNGVTQAGR